MRRQELNTIKSFNRIPQTKLVDFIVNILVKTRITPNQITLFSFILGLVSCGFFAFTSYPTIVIGAVLVYLSYIFEIVDGNIARKKGISSRLGEWYDKVADHILYTLLFISIPLGIYLRTGHSLIWMWGLIAFGAYELSIIVQYNFKRIVPTAMNDINKQRKSILRDLMFNDFFIFHSIIFFTVINLIKYYPMFIAFYGWMFTMLMIFVMTKKVKKC